MNRPILFEYFKSSADVLLAEFQRSRHQEASANLALNREMLCSNFLSKVLPPRLTLKNGGEIWDSHNNRTGQLDTVIIRDDCPSLTFGEGQADTYIAEGVFSVIETKSNLNREKLQEALKTLERVKSLELQSGGTSAYIGPRPLKRPLRCVFAYESVGWDTLFDELAKPENSDIADLICILDRGALIARGLILDQAGESPFLQSPGKAAALAWLYFHLITYSTQFVAHSLNLVPYFEPLNGWTD